MFHPRGPTFLELAEQALSSTERGYDLLAPKFDYTPFRTPQLILDAVAERLRALGPFDSGLDLCCGTGAGLGLLRPLCRRRVVGIDLSRGMLAVCRRQIADAPGAAPVELVRGNVLALPFGPSFDVAVCFGALGHILRRDEPRFFREVARVLRPGGRFAFVTTTMPSAWSMRFWLSRLFNGAMWLRNRLVSPPFIMYYLNFLLPGVAADLRRLGLEVEVGGLGLGGRWADLRLVIATRPVSAAGPVPPPPPPE
jgi:ubiquinone/menaquinone biosynthesis C-methylase UbiE